MRHEKIFKKENDTAYKIMVDVRLDNYRHNEIARYGCDVVYREKGKRKWLSVPDTIYEHHLRRLSMEDRTKHKDSNMLRFVSKEDILSVKLELWELMKPVI